jgi:hypothetical protein
MDLEDDIHRHLLPTTKKNNYIPLYSSSDFGKKWHYLRPIYLGRAY